MCIWDERVSVRYWGELAMVGPSSASQLAGWLLAAALFFGQVPPLCAEAPPVKPGPSSARQPATNPGRGEPASPSWNAERVALLTMRLADEHFAVREASSLELASAPPRFLPLLQATASHAEDPETRKRLQEAVKGIFTGQVVRQLPEWQRPHGFLGIRWTISDNPPGVQVQEVIADTAAAQGGVQAGDVIIQVDGKLFQPGLTHEEAMVVWRTMLSGDAMTLGVRRPDAEEPVTLKLTVGAPAEQYRRPDTDAEREQQLWARYLDGKLRVPPALLEAGSSSPQKAPADVAKPRRRPLQSWPPELEAPPASK
jgi:hypothetical protein